MPKVVPVEDVTAGMITAEPVRNSVGQTLLGADVELSERHANLLRTWGVKTLIIKTSANEGVIEISDEMRGAAEEHLFSRTSWRPRNEIESTLFGFVIERIATRGK
jgi:hypothetical protein